MPHPQHTFEHLLTLGWTSRRSAERMGSQTCRVTLVLADHFGNIISECRGEGLSFGAAQLLAATRANAYLFRTQQR